MTPDRAERSDPRYYPPRPPAGPPDEHPGMANYPSDGVDHRRQRRSSTPSANRYLPPLEDRQPNRSEPPPRVGAGAGRGSNRAPARPPQRSREMGSKMYGLFQRAATADGADKSGLTALTYPVMANFAVDAAMAVALANTLFFAAASGESKSKVALYLLITIAPFAVIAPLIGPALDRLQHGRRVALATSFVLRTVLARGAHRQLRRRDRQLPVLGAVPVRAGNDGVVQVFQRAAQRRHAAGAAADDRPGAGELSADGVRPARRDDPRRRDRRRRRVSVQAVPTCPARCTSSSRSRVAGAALSMRIPKWVEVTEGEVPATLSYHGRSGELRRHPHGTPTPATPDNRWAATSLPSLWGNCTIKVMVGFLFLYPAFVAKSHDAERLGAVAHPRPDRRGRGDRQLRRQLHQRAASTRPSRTAGGSLQRSRSPLAALATALTGKLMVAALATLVTSAASAIAKASLDASLQDDLPEESRASAFGRSESLLQLAWVAGGATGVLVYTDLWIGFTVITSMLILGLAQTLVSYRGDSLIPGLGGNRPVLAAARGRRPTLRRCRASEEWSWPCWRPSRCWRLSPPAY